MEHLSQEGSAIYSTLSSAAAAQHESNKREIADLIVQSVHSAVDAAVARSVESISKAIADMQLYADGIESSLQQHLEELRAQVGLATCSVEPDLSRPPVGDTETGPDGRRGSSTTRRQGVGAPGPYIPPPARGNLQIHSMFLALLMLRTKVPIRHLVVES